MIEFSESPCSDGTIRFTWKAAHHEEFIRVVDLVKSTIPPFGRRYDPAERAWFIGTEHAPKIQDIKEAVAETPADKPLESRIEQQNAADARLVFASLRSLSEPLYSRALFAAEAAIGRIDATVQYSLSSKQFGAWSDEDGVWYYTDGHYSRTSPEELDKRATKAALRELQGNLRELVVRDNISAKAELRARMLEKYEHKCYACMRTPKEERHLHMHRVVPGKDGGLYVEGNVVLLCLKCHRRFEGSTWEKINARRERGIRSRRGRKCR